MRRRDFLHGVLLAGCSAEAKDREPPAPIGACDDAFAGGTFRGVLPFVDEDDVLLDTPTGAGLDGRLYTDLSKLTESALIVPNERFYIRTRYPDRLDPKRAWIVRVGEGAIPIADLVARSRPMGATLLECSGNFLGAHFGMLSAAEWSGVPLLDVLGPSIDETKRVLVSGFDDHSQPSARSTPGASWIFGVEQLRAAGAFLATGMNGAPLPPDHGAPVRLVMPGWYGCTCIKWVDTIQLVADDAPATPHMLEFASRTEQVGAPERARDYLPATIDLAAMPVRIERWTVDGRDRVRLFGVVWGSDRLGDDLTITIGDAPPERVRICAPRTTATTWGSWAHDWSPPGPGRYRVTLQARDRATRTRRLDRGFYGRHFVL